MADKKKPKKLPLKKQTVRKQGQLDDREADKVAGGTGLTTQCRKAGGDP
jgi:hypothetical protein